MPIPTIQELLDAPLYETFAISEKDILAIDRLLSFQGTIDAHCISCKMNSTFSGTNLNQEHVPSILKSMSAPSTSNFNSYILDGRESKTYIINLLCTRKNRHELNLILHISINELIKIGQYPSLADLTYPELTKYKAVLNNDKYKELTKAIGLASHGIGIGSFVYLRRIFECLIEEAHQVSSGTIDESKYAQGRMDEKINLLKSYLPEYLIENRKIYSILSKGVHELSEDECLTFFDTVKLGIELILDEKVEKEIKRKKIAASKDALEKIHAKLKT